MVPGPPFSRNRTANSPSAQNSVAASSYWPPPASEAIPLDQLEATLQTYTDSSRLFSLWLFEKISVSCESKSKTISFIHNIQLFVRPRYRRRIVNKRNRKLQSQVITHSRKMNWWNVSCVKTPHQTHYSNNNQSVYTPNWTSVDYPNAMRLCKKLFISFSTADIISITFLTNKVNLL